MVHKSTKPEADSPDPGVLTGYWAKEYARLQAENDRLRINLRDYRQKHRCSHAVMCWADELAAKALGSDKD